MTLSAFNGEEINSILSSNGPIVKCVLIRSGEKADNEVDVKEVTVDTTPQKREVEALLGGKITFIGQYIEEGVVAMTVKKHEGDKEGEEEEEKEEGSNCNKIKLPPPLDHVDIAGNVVLMKVSKESEEGESGDNTEENSEEVEEKKEFFLDYTLSEYNALVERGGETMPENQDEEETTDSEEEVDDSASIEDVEEDDDDDEDEEFPMKCDEIDLESDEERIGMLNLCMGQILRKFHEDNGHGPDTRQLLEMRQALAEKLGVEVPDLPPHDDDDEEQEDDIEDEENGIDNTLDAKKKHLSNTKRMRKSLDAQDQSPRKRVKFSNMVEEQEIVSLEEEDHVLDATHHTDQEITCP